MPVVEQIDSKTKEDDIFQQTANIVANMLREKNRSYGSAYGKAPEFLRLLYPDGIKIEQYKDVLFCMRIFDKLMRIANQKGAFNEDAFLDISGYSALAMIENAIEQADDENE